MLSLLSFWRIRNIEVLPGCLPTKPPSGNLPCETPISNLSHSTLSSFTRTALVLVLTFDHNYANTSSILVVQRPATFHLGSLERVCKVPRRYSNHSPHGNSYKFMDSGVDPLLFFGIFFFLQKSRITHHTLTKNTSSMTICRQTIVLLDQQPQEQHKQHTV